MLCGRIWPSSALAAQGREGIKELLKIIASEQDARLPVDAHTSPVVLAAGLQAVQTMIGSIEKRIMAQHRSSEQRLESITVDPTTTIISERCNPRLRGRGTGGGSAAHVSLRQFTGRY
jgi:hypothetical protein